MAGLRDEKIFTCDAWRIRLFADATFVRYLQLTEAAYFHD
jgi:hypothetical protein